VINCPLAAGEGDKAFQDALESTIVPATEAFRPDFILVSAGFDAHHADPLGSMVVTEQGFFQLTRTIRELADAACGGRLVTVLEGGYDLDALPGCVAAHLAALQGKAEI
jgi:acetoin utilization deacetylase AcuC-like enzyme